MTRPVNIKFSHLPAFDELYYGAWQELALFGGRGAAKSHSVAEYFILCAISSKTRLLCTREIQESISDSVLKLLADKITALNLDNYFDVQRKIIYCKNGSEILFKGIKHNISSIKSIENITHVWCEEAQTISKESLDILIPTIIRNKNAKIIYTYNPTFATDAVHMRFNAKILPPKSIIKQIFWQDNPYFNDAMKKAMAFDFKHDPAVAEHVWNGALMPSGNDTAVLPMHWLRKCVDVHKKLELPASFNYLGLDLADGGKDKSAIAIRCGAILKFVQEFERPIINQTVAYADGMAKLHNVIRIYFDAIGIGAGAKGDFNRLTRPYSVEPFIGSASPKGKDFKFTDSMTNGQFFRNLKSQAWWNLRLKLENTLRLLDGENINVANCFFIDSKIENLEKLLLELSQASYKHDDGKLMVDKAPEKGMASPNMADAVIMAYSHDMRRGLTAR